MGSFEKWEGALSGGNTVEPGALEVGAVELACGAGLWSGKASAAGPSQRVALEAEKGAERLDGTTRWNDSTERLHEGSGAHRDMRTASDSP